MQLMLLFSVLLLGIKFIAWWITRSNAILTDALESIVNVVAGSVALFSMWYAGRPRDEGHPYGHGKIEFVAAGFEGALVLLAGGGIVFAAVRGFFYPHEIMRLDDGAILIAGAGITNFFMGFYLLRRGKRQDSALMVANGKHLLVDTLTSLGLVGGLLLIYYTGYDWVDNLLATILGLIIIYTGFRLVRVSLGSLLDEQDYEKITQLIEVLNRNRRDNWIDIHKLRVLKYGSGLHIDAHLTLPWYLTLTEAHAEVHAMEKVVAAGIGPEVEFFIHTDPCLPQSCPLCTVQNCPHRQAEHVRKVTWARENLLPDQKHKI